LIKKSNDSIKKTFKGIAFDVLAVGEKSMVTKMNYKQGEVVPFHQHPNEQAGYVISGKYRLHFSNKIDLIETGDSYVIPENTEHKIEVIEPGFVIDVFTPPRQDYL
jgi:quercetin dioxygenase-like cupin family protein